MKTKRILLAGGVLVVILALALVVWAQLLSSSIPSSQALPAGLAVFPPDNIWNTPVDTAPLHPRSAEWMDTINGHSRHPVHPDFGYMYRGHTNGIPYNVVGAATPKVTVVFNPAGNYSKESDPLPPGGLPIPKDALIEGDPPPQDKNGDRHLILVDVDAKVLHELFSVWRPPDGPWLCSQYSRWDLTSNALRRDEFTSADAAGLPIFPGLVRWDEIERGEITHALRFTLDLTWKPHLWPARHSAPSGGPKNPPMGMRVRLKGDFDIAGYSKTNQIILRALKKYGMMLADNGGDWFISGAPNANFSDRDLRQLKRIVPAEAFEVVDVSLWQVAPDSARADRSKTR